MLHNYLLYYEEQGSLLYYLHLLYYKTNHNIYFKITHILSTLSKYEKAPLVNFRMVIHHNNELLK